MLHLKMHGYDHVLDKMNDFCIAYDNYFNSYNILEWYMT